MTDTLDGSLHSIGERCHFLRQSLSLGVDCSQLVDGRHAQSDIARFDQHLLHTLVSTLVVLNVI